MDYSKLSDNDLRALYSGNIDSISNEGLKMLYGNTETTSNDHEYKGIDYSDILNNANLTKEQKVAEMQKRLEAENKNIDKETKKDIAKMWTGGALEIASAAIPVGGGLKLATKLARAGKPAIARAAGSILKNTPGLAASGAVGGFGGALRNGKETIQDYLKDTAIGAASGVALGKGLQYGSKAGKAILDSEAVKKGVPKVLELFTSVPAEYSERAIRKELAGDSIFKGKFNRKDLDEAYKEAGSRAIKGLKNAELDANIAIDAATKNLNNLPAINRTKLTEEIVEDLDKFRRGGSRNAALDEKSAQIYEYLNEIANDTYNSDLSATKGKIQNLISSKYGQETGEGVRALKGIGNKIKETLDELSPEYAAANETRANLYDIKNILGGLNKKTLASRLRNVEGDASVRSGYNQAAEALENLVSPQYKFLDEVKDLRAREALEQWYPGQYGGSGTPQGAANLLRASGIGTLGAITHNPIATILATLAVSPKIHAQGTIRNIGKLKNLNQHISNIYDKALQQNLNRANAVIKAGSSKATAQETDKNK